MAAALGSAAAVLLLFLPIDMPPGSRLWHAAGGSVHVLLFAGLAWIWGRQLPVHLRGWVLWAVLAAFSAFAEGLQPNVGRSAEWSDWLYGAAGAAGICGTWNWRQHVRIWWAGVIALCLFPLAWEAGLFQMETRAFPMLAEPGRAWARRGWTLNSVQITSIPDEGFRVEADPVAETDAAVSYPGVFRATACSDWRGTKALRASLFWPATNEVYFAFRVDDQAGNAPYSKRFQREFAVTQGWNSVRIPVEDLRWTSGGRPLDLSSIQHWGVFLVSDAPFDYFLLGSVCLDLQQERP